MNRMKVKIIAGILAVFLLGVATGVLGTGIVIHRKFRQFTMGENPFQTFFMRRLNRELNLTEAQKPRVEKIIAQGAVEVRQYLQDSRLEFETIMERRNTQLKEILTPEQQEKLDAMQEKIRQRWHPEAHHEGRKE